jgi:glycosyltransferase involved in cell wall biosynthesis
MESNYSVLMPLWYKEKPEFLKASIASMAKQTMPPAEFVLVRDHEIPQELLKVIEESSADIPVNYVDAYELFGQGLGAILARGVEHCSYELIARMDSDDIAFLDRCEKQLVVFGRNPRLAVVGGTIAEFSDTPEDIISYRIVPEKHDDIIKFAKFRSPFNHPSVMFRKSIILYIGNYNVKYKKYEDCELWFRFLKNGYIGYNIQEPIIYYRAGSHLIKNRSEKEHYKYILKLKKEMKKAKFINWFEYQISVNINRFFHYAPYSIKRLIFILLLRKRRISE